MDSNSTVYANEHTQQLLDAQAHICNHIFYFLNSMAVKCAIELGIPDAIQKHGKPVTLNELATALDIHPTRAPSLNRLMRLLVHSRFFSKEKLANGEVVFGLTINSQLLLRNHPLSLADFAIFVLNPITVNPANHISSWFRNDTVSPFHSCHGRNIWQQAETMTEYSECLNQAMASDSRFVARLLTSSNECKSLFKGIKSLVDVGGGDGTMAKTIAEAYPGLKCVVLDLPYVVEGLQGNGLNVEYIGGNMFEAIPPAQVVLLKSILHDWSDDQCIQILQRCKEAIPSSDQGGKVIIIDIVVDENSARNEHSNAQILFDMEMMSLTNGGKERSEEEWKKIFVNAGFGCDYKVLDVLGPRSVIEICPL
ncbi:hypothetical protein Cgig2_010184 [Carnegiea gigantea]|uniref:O-methyltransferase n=1 Tax=Carnegiea gigantea TaxID=171969 RepID=A0A9Q1KAI1_9CARY|nr:hypothetical protein Cgig2_010184 [Carnegiea gigantea]